MHLSLPCFGFALLNAITTVAIAPAPLLGPAYPPPTDLTTTSSVVPKAWAEVANTLTSWTASKDPVEGQVPDFGSYTFSVGAFSMYDPGAAEMLQYHHTAPDVKNSTTGATEADGDSVYRIESVSKVFTVYLTLIKIGSVYWDRSITEFIPYLADFAKKTTPDPLNVVDWTDVTLGALAGHLAGVPRDISIASDDVLLSQGLDVSAEGLPPLNVSDPSSIDPCFRYDNATNTSCMGTPYLEAVTKRPPIFLPWSTPIYSNLAYNLLSLALTNITNQTFAAALQKDMLDPLSLTSTGLSGTKNLSHVIIPGGLSDASIDTTDYASGDSSFLILSPDHGAGFSILISGVQDPSKACSAVADALTSIVLPAFEAQAATEASQHFAGTYISRTPGLNSSIELVVNASYGPGLVLNSWVSNGTDMFSWLIAAGITDELSLFPTDLRSAPADKVGQWAFRATYGNSSLMSTEGLGPFMKQTVGAEIFQAVDSYFYGGVSLDLFVVDVDGNGSATSVTPAITRAKLDRHF